MFIIIVSILLLLFLALAGADLLVSNINSDELSNMGVEEKSGPNTPNATSPMPVLHGHRAFYLSTTV
jgi:hypothetical protein